MAAGEIYIKLVVNFPNDPKVRALARYGDDAGLARDLYVQMLLYCKSMLSDGFVPAEQVGLLVYPLPSDRGNQLAKQLASVGLVNELSNDGAPGWQVLAFLKRNRSREEVEQLSEIRAEAGREGGLKSRKPPGQKRSQANCKQVANQGASKQDPREQRTENRDTDASNEASVSGAPAPPKRGTRIAADFAARVTPEMVAWSRRRSPHVDGALETEKFVNYWTAKSGKDATKIDWVATWQNWMLTAEERAPHTRASANGQSPLPDMSPRDEYRLRR